MIRLALRVQRADAEVALAELLELAPGGVEEVDRGDFVEYAVYGAPGELPELPDLEAAVGGALVEVTTSELPDDWTERWKAFHKPLVLGDRLVVRPPWEAPLGAAVELVIDPAQAFGTGSHATTKLCLELLLSLAEESAERGPLVDVGCGSGVLAIAAAKLGWAPVVAVDYDPLSVDATIENARVNEVALDVRRRDLRTETMPNLPQPPQRLIASGLLVHEADEIAAAFERHGLRERARLEQGEWAALLLAASA
jgi:ribosomal protein L11 methyltransferase